MMPGVGFEEMILLVVVAIVVIGPKDLPLMMRKFGRFTGKMRAMAFEFKQGFDELGRQAELEELRKEVADLKKHTGLEDLKREFEQDRRDLEQDVNSAMAAGDPSPAPATPEPGETPTIAAPAETQAIAAPPLEETPGNTLPRVRSEDKWPKPHKRKPTVHAPAETAPYAGLSPEHPGYDVGDDFRLEGHPPEPAAPVNGEVVNGEAAGDVHVIPDDHVRPTHPAATLAPAKQDTTA